MLSVKGEFDVASTESRATGMVGNNPCGSREIPMTSNFSELDRSEKGRCHMSLCGVRTVMASLRLPEAGIPHSGEWVHDARDTRQQPAKE